MTIIMIIIAFVALGVGNHYYVKAKYGNDDCDNTYVYYSVSTKPNKTNINNSVSVKLTKSIVGGLSKGARHTYMKTTKYHKRKNHLAISRNSCHRRRR